MAIFYVTFGQKNRLLPAKEWDGLPADPDGFVTIEAPSYAVAHRWANEHWGNHYSSLYLAESDIGMEPEFYPRGEMARYAIEADDA